MALDRYTIAPTPRTDEEPHDDVVYPSPIPFVLVHVAALAAIFTGVTVQALVLCLVLYVVRMFGVTAGYHRYFAHRSFKTSRVAQFLLAWLAQSSAQRGALWWATKHRHHHRHSDTDFDVHSPRHHGFWYAHVGWIFQPNARATDYDAIRDFAKYPDLVWLNRNRYLPAIVLAVATWFFFGWTGLVVGFIWSTVLLYHGTFFINSLAHVHGAKRYITGDDSRNNWWLAIITMGEGWHNNHHAYMASTRQGFRWFEWDPTYYILKVLSWARIVSNLNEPPAALVRNERKLARGMVEKVARQLTATLSVERMVEDLRVAWENTPTWDEVCERAGIARSEAVTMLSEMQLPHIPSTDELRQRAQEMFANAPSLDEIVARAREIIFEAITAEMLPAPSGA